MRRVILGLATCAVATVWPAIASADDKQFSQEIATALRDSGRLADYSVGVTSKGGVVYLKGRVSNKDQMIEAVQLTSNLPGVSKVVNHLEIKASKKAAAAPQPNKMEVAAAKVAADAQGAVEEGMTTVRKTIFPDPSLPAEAAPRQNSQPVKRRTKPAAVAKRSPSPATNKAYAVQQTSQNAPDAFMPGESAEMMQAPPMPPQPVMGGPQMSARRVAMAPLAVAGAAAGAAMGQCPPGAMDGGPGGMMGGGPGGGGPMPMGVPAVGGGVAPARYDQPHMPNYAWPSYAASPNYAAVSYPRQYSPTAWPYIGPFYPYPQVPLGWRKVMLEWDDGWWMLNFKQ